MAAAGSGHRLGSVARVRAPVHGHYRGLGVRTAECRRYRGSGLQLGRSAAQLKELRGPGVAAFPSDLTRYQQVELVAAAHLSSAAEALRQLDSDHRAALWPSLM